uniref:Secreted protein n=1 Tax=Arundo donax TaxID=35708 RepID=A0A0A8ZEB6_ARUDO
MHAPSLLSLSSPSAKLLLLCRIAWLALCLGEHTNFRALMSLLRIKRRGFLQSRQEFTMWALLGFGSHVQCMLSGSWPDTAS